MLNQKLIILQWEGDFSNYHLIKDYSAPLLSQPIIELHLRVEFRIYFNIDHLFLRFFTLFMLFYKNPPNYLLSYLIVISF